MRIDYLAAIFPAIAYTIGLVAIFRLRDRYHDRGYRLALEHAREELKRKSSAAETPVETVERLLAEM